MQGFNKQGKRMLILAFGICLLIGIGGYFYWEWKANLPTIPLGEPPSWRGIVLGKTSLAEARQMIGAPDDLEVRDQYQIYQYQNRTELHWKDIELWAEERQGKDIVVGIYRALPYYMSVKAEEVAEILNLKQLVEGYQLDSRPDKVTWTFHCASRYLIWSHRGVASHTDTRADKFGIENLRVVEILLFEPMPLAKTLRTDWPWTPSPISGWASRNFCPRHDPYPEDPYAWEDLFPEEPSD